MPTALIFVSAVALLLIALALLLPAGWLPAAVFGLIALVAVVPAAVAAWLLYRRMVRRGEIPPLGRDIDRPTARSRLDPDVDEQRGHRGRSAA
jgi:uncharacterized membrane protein